MKIMVKQRKLPPGALYQWHYPYLIIPLDCSLADLKQIISAIEKAHLVLPTQSEPCKTPGQSKQGLAMPL